jgi:uncharacterized membrane protein HdeD (DUF308 family)
MATAPTPSRFVGVRDPAELINKLRKGRHLLTIAGVLLMIVGAVAIIVPAVASVATAIFIGWVLIAGGVFMIADAVAVREGEWMAIRLLLALLALAAGLYLVLAPLSGVYTLTVMLVIWFVAVGIARVVVGIAEHGLPGAGMTVASGVLALVLGILIAEQLPSSADWAIGLIVGVDLLFSGTILVLIARSLQAVVP